MGATPVAVARPVVAESGMAEVELAATIGAMIVQIAASRGADAVELAASAGFDLVCHLTGSDSLRGPPLHSRDPSHQGFIAVRPFDARWLPGVGPGQPPLPDGGCDLLSLLAALTAARRNSTRRRPRADRGSTGRSAPRAGTPRAC